MRLTEPLQPVAQLCFPVARPHLSNVRDEVLVLLVLLILEEPRWVRGIWIVAGPAALVQGV